MSILILGASGGIGVQVARQLRAAGHTVLLASRKSDRLDELAKRIRSSRMGARRCSNRRINTRFLSRRILPVLPSGKFDCRGSL